ncbi:MAG: hypothetical protein IKH49_07950, partial [Bacteroidales bacterium]|nr:hypothetical protein [Bacteroidales bacterium]
TEYFARGTVPSESCDRHIRATICGESGMTPTPDCPEEGLIQRTFMTIPAEEAAWAFSGRSTASGLSSGC